MLGPRHLPTATELLNFEKGISKHHKRLVEIQRNEANKKLVEKDGSEKTKQFEVREKIIKFHNAERAQAIEKDNETLLGRLVEISRKKKGLLCPLPESSQSLKSLNAPSRKLEKQRIAMENEAFARRLLSQQPSFNRRKLDNDYEKHAERVKLMQKLASNSPRKIKLPPLNYNKYEDDFGAQRKSQSGKEKREVKDFAKKKKRKNPKKISEDEKEDIAEEEERKEKERLQQQLEIEEKIKKDRQELENRLKAGEEKNENDERLTKDPEEEKIKQQEEEKIRQQQEEEKRKKEEDEKIRLEEEAKLKAQDQLPKATSEEDTKWKKIDAKDGENPLLGMIRHEVAQRR